MVRRGGQVVWTRVGAIAAFRRRQFVVAAVVAWFLVSLPPLPVKAVSISSEKFLPNASVATAVSPGYLTLLFGRTMWTASATCTVIPGQPTLLDIAAALQPRTAAGAVVTDWVGASTEQCIHKNLYPSWSDLGALRDQYGWSMVSEGESHANMLQLTPQQQVTESCGSLTDPTHGLYIHGHNRAWGLFAYANAKHDSQIQSNVVAKCFAFGRTYKGGVNLRSQITAPWFQSTNSVLGGTCHNAGAPCASHVITNRLGKAVYYESPATLMSLMNVGSDQWVVVQMYKLVKGSNPGKTAWDCTSSDWHNHWTSLPEMYCYDDYFAAVATIPAGVQTVDPAYVAEQWNSNPQVTAKPAPVLQSISPPGGPVGGGTTVTISGSGFTAATGVAFGPRQATSFTIVSDAQIRAVSPAGTGVVDTAVMTTKGLSATKAADQFAYG